MEWVGDGFLVHSGTYGATHFSPSDADALLRGHIHPDNPFERDEWNARP
jgi:hypothetical protein